MSSDHKTDTRSGGVELVADQGDDGSFEIRLERQQDAEEETQPADAQRTATWHAQPEAQIRRAGTSKAILLGVAAAVAILVIITAVILAQAPRNLGGGRPQTVEVNEQPRFRGYVVAGQEPERASNLRLDAEETDEDADEEEDGYLNEDLYDNADENEAEEDSGPTRINLRSAASGKPSASPDDEVELTPAQERRQEIERRQREASETFRRELREYQRQRSEEEQGDALDDELDDFEVDYYDELDEELDDYDLDEFDEYDDYDLEGER